LITNNNLKIKNMLTVRRFSASWCAPCRQLAPIMESVSTRFSDVNFITIDVDENKVEAQRYGIRSVPTVIIERDGVEVTRFLGLRNENSIVSLINESR